MAAIFFEFDDLLYCKFTLVADFIKTKKFGWLFLKIALNCAYLTLNRNSFITSSPI
jgi:hypothetical protein